MRRRIDASTRRHRCIDIDGSRSTSTSMSTLSLALTSTSSRGRAGKGTHEKVEAIGCVGNVALYVELHEKRREEKIIDVKSIVEMR